jgi:hypothetical protein
MVALIHPERGAAQRQGEGKGILRTWLSAPKAEQLLIQLADEPGAVEHIQSLLREKDFTVTGVASERDAETAEIRHELTIKPTVQAAGGGAYPADAPEQGLRPLCADSGLKRAREARTATISIYEGGASLPF